MDFTAFSRFINSIDSPVILLEGSRVVEEIDKAKIVELGKQLAVAFPSAIFRSGNANASDNLFAEGVLQVNPERLELVLSNKSKLKSIHGEIGLYLPINQTSDSD